jgi:hypothetical protein
MTLENHGIETESGRSASFVFLVASVVGLIALGAFISWLIRGKGEVVAAKRDIPAFTLLSRADLEEKSVRKQGREIGPGSIDEFVGKYTGAALAQGDEVDGEGLIDAGPHGIGEVRIQVQPDQADALGFAVGEEVRLWLAPTKRVGAEIVLCARLLGIPEAASPAEQTYVVGLSKRNAHRLIDRLGRSRLLITHPG